jgi:hypothetical protein
LINVNATAPFFTAMIEAGAFIKESGELTEGLRMATGVPTHKAEHDVSTPAGTERGQWQNQRQNAGGEAPTGETAPLQPQRGDWQRWI